MIVALPLILLAQEVLAFVANTLYVPATSIAPKSNAAPVPDTALPCADAPLYN